MGGPSSRWTEQIFGWTWGGGLRKSATGQIVVDWEFHFPPDRKSRWRVAPRIRNPNIKPSGASYGPKMSFRHKISQHRFGSGRGRALSWSVPTRVPGQARTATRGRHSPAPVPLTAVKLNPNVTPTGQNFARVLDRLGSLRVRRARALHFWKREILQNDV